MTDNLLTRDNRLADYKTAVSEFRNAFGFLSPRFWEDVTTEGCKLQARLIQEEWMEYEHSNTRVGIIDALADLMYVCVGGIIAARALVEPVLLPTTMEGIRRTETKLGMANEVARACNELNKYQLCAAGLKTSLQALYNRIEQAAVVAGIDLPQAFNIVHKSNMNKLWPEEQWLKVTNKGSFKAAYVPSEKRWLVKDLNGKLIKPPGFVPPDLKDL